jgi:hypothetical protein
LEHLPLPPLRLRLALVAAQMLIYYQRFPPSKAHLGFYKAAVDAAEADLDPEYRRKVVAEFVRAVREADACAGDCGRDANDGTHDGELSDEDVVDDVCNLCVMCSGWDELVVFVLA